MTRDEFEHTCSTIRGDLIALARRFRRAVGGPEEAEDIAQEALVILWELSERDYPVRDYKALAIKITKNICLTRLRKRNAENLPIEGLQIEGGSSAEERVETTDNQRIKESIYGQLSKSQVEYFTLRNEDGLSLDQIAEKTGKPKSCIKVIMSIARKKMREQLKKL